MFFGKRVDNAAEGLRQALEDNRKACDDFMCEVSRILAPEPAERRQEAPAQVRRAVRGRN